MKWPAISVRWRSISPGAKEALCLLAAGGTLKAHRGLDGAKTHRLHPLHGPEIEVPADVVEQLRARRLIDSNKKFPVATYLLTQHGQQKASMFIETASLPLGSRQF